MAQKTADGAMTTPLYFASDADGGGPCPRASILCVGVGYCWRWVSSFFLCSALELAIVILARVRVPALGAALRLALALALALVLPLPPTAGMSQGVAL